GGRAARRAAGNRGLVPGIERRTVRAILGRRTHRELVHVRLAEEDGPSLLEAAYDRGIIGGPERPEHPAPAGRRLPLDAEQVLDRHRNARQGTDRVTGLAPLVDRAGLTENVVGIEMNEHVEAFQPIGAVEQAYDDLFGADGPLLQVGKQSRRGSIVHQSESCTWARVQTGRSPGTSWFASLSLAREPA